MAKKKLFGNVKEPQCATCAHGKLSVNGESVLCVQGGALPLDHHCRRYQYDPLRRVPRRRPELSEYAAADFSLDDAPDTATETPTPTPDETPEHAALHRLFAYLDEHETPDADTIRAILNKSYTSDEQHEDDLEDVAENATKEQQNAASEDEPMSDEDVLNRLVEEAERLMSKRSSDNPPAMDEELEQSDPAMFSDFTILTPPDTDEPFLVPDKSTDDVGFLIDTLDETDDAMLSVDDLLFLPKGTPSDHDTADDVGGGFTPLTGDE